MSEIKITKEQIQKLLSESKVWDMQVGDKTTMVVATLPNGFVLTESSSCVDPANYDHELGKKICMERIEEKLWYLEGYRLQCMVTISEKAYLADPKDTCYPGTIAPKVDDRLVSKGSNKHLRIVALVHNASLGVIPSDYAIRGVGRLAYMQSDFPPTVMAEVALIHFQNGPIKEVGVNGCQTEDIIVILIDRMRCFQSGTFPCRENNNALMHLEEALMWLNKRTADRKARSVEGTMQE